MTTETAPEIAPAAAPRRRTLDDLPGPRGWPLLGHLAQIDLERLHLVLEGWQREYGPMYRIRLGPKPVLVCSDHEVLQTVLRERPQRFRRLSAVEPVFDEIGCNGVFSAEGEVWRVQRKLVMQALNATHFRGFFPVLQRIVGRLHARWRRAAAGGRVLEMRDELTRFTVDATTALAFGEDPNTVDGCADPIQQHLSQVFPMVMSRVNAAVPYWRWFKLPRDRRFERALAAVHAHVQGLIDRNRERMAAVPGAPPANLLQALLAARGDDGQGLTDADVAANVFTLLLGGEDTTAHSLAWAMFYLSDAPALQQQLHAEACRHFGAEPLCPAFGTLRELGAFEAVVDESLRLKPTVPALYLEANEDTGVGDIAVPAGTALFFLLRPDMVDARLFADPGRFDPARWAPRGHGVAACPVAHTPRAHLQFGAGARVCPGRHLAQVEMRLVLSMLLRNFSLQLACRRDEVHEVMAFTMMPSRMPIRLGPPCSLPVAALQAAPGQWSGPSPGTIGPPDRSCPGSAPHGGFASGPA